MFYQHKSVSSHLTLHMLIFTDIGIYQVISTTKRAMQQKSFGSTVLALSFFPLRYTGKALETFSFIHAIIHQTVVPSPVRNTY
jgi:hypothetical protein